MAESRRKKTTATGEALVRLALALKKKDPSLTLDEAKYQVKQEMKAAKNLGKQKEALEGRLKYGAGGNLKNKILTRLLGPQIGGFIAKNVRTGIGDEDVAKKLIQLEEQKPDFSAGGFDNDVKYTRFDNSKKSRKADEAKSLRRGDYQKILEKLMTIEASLKAIKTVKVADPNQKEDKAPVTEKSPHHEDAALGLKALGYKKHEVEEMLKGAQGSTAQELIKNALKPKNSERVPAAQVPVAVAAAKAATPVTQPMIPAAAPVPHNTDEKQENEQADAGRVKKEAEAAENEKEHRKEEKTVHEKLDEILEHVKGGGLLGMIGTLIGGLLGKVFGPIMKLLGPMFSLVGRIAGILGRFVGPVLRLVGRFLGPAALVAGAGALGYEAGKFIEQKFDLGNKIGGLLSGDQGNKAHALDEGVQRTNKTLEGTGYTAIGAGKFKDMEGNIVTRDQLPADVASKLTYGSVKPTAVPASVKAEVAAPAAQSAAAEKIDSASTDNTDMKTSAAAPVINQNIDARKTTQVMTTGGKSGGSNVNVTTRNMEQSVASYIGSIFNHTVLRPPM